MANQPTATELANKLDFNLPLISTRRLRDASTANSHFTPQDTENGVPFCWEQTPGKPKNVARKDAEEMETPRPRLPPCRWQPQDQEINGQDYEDIDNQASDLLSYTVEVLSLTQAMDMVEKAEENDHHQNQGLEGLNLESFESKDDDSVCRNYMMERFLPDATALAASSVIYASNNFNKIPCSYTEYNYGDQDCVSRSCSSQWSNKGCGFEMLFPWRIKHKLCGVKTPIRQVRHNKHTPISRVIKKRI